MDILKANWPAPSSILALSTTRMGGVSLTPFHSNNMGMHVGDDEAHVLHNRHQLIEALNLPRAPEWLEQTHSTRCVVIEETADRCADAAVTRVPNTTLAIMTADCLPILLTNQRGDEVAAIHAGWRGLHNGIIQSTLAKMHATPDTLMAWIGPAICERCYEIGEEVYTAFVTSYPFTRTTFEKRGQSLYANLPKLAELILQDHGISAVYLSHQCTFEAKPINNTENRYFSYRREKQTGRIVTLIGFNLG